MLPMMECENSALMGQSDDAMLEMMVTLSMFALGYTVFSDRARRQVLKMVGRDESGRSHGDAVSSQDPCEDPIARQ